MNLQPPKSLTPCSLSVLIVDSQKPYLTRHSHHPPITSIATTMEVRSSSAVWVSSSSRTSRRGTAYSTASHLHWTQHWFYRRVSTRSLPYMARAPITSTTIMLSSSSPVLAMCTLTSRCFPQPTLCQAENTKRNSSKTTKRPWQERLAPTTTPCSRWSRRHRRRCPTAVAGSGLTER